MYVTTIFIISHYLSMSLYQSIQDQMKVAYAFLSDEYDVWLMEYMLYPDQVHEVSIPVVMDDGKTQTFTWFRSQHNNIKWPYKWWIRFHQDVSKDEVMSLSAWMSLKCSVVWIPLWWGKWWVIVNPKELSERELEKDTFYILTTKEAIRVPSGYSMELVPSSHLMGELRVHYAWFFDPGWWGDFWRVGVLEVRPYEDLIIYDGQPICLAQLYTNKAIPDQVYGDAWNNYHQQEWPKLAKYFY
jgi:hypothetical protein